MTVVFYSKPVHWSIPEPEPTLDGGTVIKEKEEMCIPKIPLDGIIDSHVLASVPTLEIEEWPCFLNEDVMKEIYKEEVFAQLEKDIEEEERLVVIEPFVREMCDYYKMPQEDYVMWQHYYNYIIEETVQVYAAKGRETPKNYLMEVQNNFNNEMKKHVEEMKAEAFGSHMDDFWKKSLAKPLWNAIEKHK